MRRPVIASRQPIPFPRPLLLQECTAPPRSSHRIPTGPLSGKPRRNTNCTRPPLPSPGTTPNSQITPAIPHYFPLQPFTFLLFSPRSLRKKQIQTVDLSEVYDFRSVLQTFEQESRTPPGIFKLRSDFHLPVFCFEDRPGKVSNRMIDWFCLKISDCLFLFHFICLIFSMNSCQDSWSLGVYVVNWREWSNSKIIKEQGVK